MAPEVSLQQLMKNELDPKQIDLRARFNHAQIAVDMSYRLAEKQVYLEPERVANPLWKEGDSNYDKTLHIEPSSEKKISELVKAARLLKVEIEKDLNDTLKVLDGVKDGAETASPKLS